MEENGIIKIRGTKRKHEETCEKREEENEMERGRERVMTTIMYNVHVCVKASITFFDRIVRTLVRSLRFEAMSRTPKNR